MSLNKYEPTKLQNSFGQYKRTQKDQTIYLCVGYFGTEIVETQWDHSRTSS